MLCVAALLASAVAAGLSLHAFAAVRYADATVPDAGNQEYKIEVTLGSGDQWITHHRYNDFHTLVRQLESTVSSRMAAKLRRSLPDVVWCVGRTNAAHASPLPCGRLSPALLSSRYGDLIRRSNMRYDVVMSRCHQFDGLLDLLLESDGVANSPAVRAFLDVDEHCSQVSGSVACRTNAGGS